MVLFPSCLDRTTDPSDFFHSELETCVGLEIWMVPMLVDWDDFSMAMPSLVDTKFGRDIKGVLHNPLLHFIDTETWDVTMIVAALQ